MSFDVFLQPIGGVSDEPGVWRLLEEAWEAPPDEHSYVRVRRGSGESDLYAAQRSEPIGSLMFSNPSGSPQIFDLIVDVARAGRMVIMPVGCPPCLTGEDELAGFPEEMAEALGRPVVVADGRELLDVIEGS